MRTAASDSSRLGFLVFGLQGLGSGFSSSGLHVSALRRRPCGSLPQQSLNAPTCKHETWQHNYSQSPTQTYQKQRNKAVAAFPCWVVTLFCALTLKIRLVGVRIELWLFPWRKQRLLETPRMATFNHQIHDFCRFPMIFIQGLYNLKPTRMMAMLNSGMPNLKPLSQVASFIRLDILKDVIWV